MEEGRVRVEDGRRPAAGPSEYVLTGEEEKLKLWRLGGENEEEDGVPEVEKLEEF